MKESSDFALRDGVLEKKSCGSAAIRFPTFWKSSQEWRSRRPRLWRLSEPPESLLQRILGWQLWSNMWIGCRVQVLQVLLLALSNLWQAPESVRRGKHLLWKPQPSPWPCIWIWNPWTLSTSLSEPAVQAEQVLVQAMSECVAIPLTFHRLLPKLSLHMFSSVYVYKIFEKGSAIRQNVECSQKIAGWYTEIVQYWAGRLRKENT